MRKIILPIGMVMLAVLMFGLVIRLASERVEVVELHTPSESEEQVVTRLWIVDHEGLQYLRSAPEASGWFARLQTNKEIRLTRKDITQCYTTRLRRDKDAQINALMQAKYTWGDSLIGALFGGREGSIPIELHPCLPRPSTAT